MAGAAAFASAFLLIDLIIQFIDTTVSATALTYCFFINSTVSATAFTCYLLLEKQQSFAKSFDKS